MLLISNYEVPGLDEEEGLLHTRETTHYLLYVLISPDKSKIYCLVNLYSKLYVTFILKWIAFIFGRDEEEDQ